MITAEFRDRVRDLRDQGKTWGEVSKLAGRPVRTCKRAVETTTRKCGQRGCQETATPNGKLCAEHAKMAMRNKPGEGYRQQEVLRHLRRHGHLSSEQLRQLTGLDASNLGQITVRLVRLGLIERPMKGHFTMPRPDNLKPQHPIAHTPDRV